MSIIYTTNAVRYMRDIKKITHRTEKSKLNSNQKIISQADEIKKLQQLYYSEDEISKLMNITKDDIKKFCKIYNAPKEIKTLLETNNFGLDEIISILDVGAYKTKEVKKLINKRKNKLGKRLYGGDTNKFEPIEENREHLINCLMPMVISVANNKTGSIKAMNEFTDMLSEGIKGAIIATDRYIEEAKTKKHTAKLSTYAYFYVVKYINEYLNFNESILSFGPTKLEDVRNCDVVSGNMVGGKSGDENFTEELFYTLGDPNLMSVDEYDNTDEVSEDLSEKLFSCLTYNEKIILFMYFGIGGCNKYEVREIAQKNGMKLKNVEKSLAESIIKLKKVFNKNEYENVVKILSGVDLSQSLHWKVSF